MNVIFFSPLSTWYAPMCCVIQKARLPVVHVPHDRDHRRFLDEIFRPVLRSDLLGCGLLHGPDLDLYLKLLGYELYLLGRERLGKGLHLP
jgi:hypothetical protein